MSRPSTLVGAMKGVKAAEGREGGDQQGYSISRALPSI